jgi:GNAT superfamily N-acetyltransferase
MEFRVTNKIDRSIISQAAKLHYESLSYRSFITLFGQRFLELLYEMLLQEQLAFFVVAIEEDRLLGFLLACYDSSKLSQVMIKRSGLFFPIMLNVLIKKPYLIKNIFETVFYSTKEGKDIKPELLVMAVDEAHRSLGIGSKMIATLEEEFLRLGYKRYKVTVHQGMARSNKFYQANKMRFLKDFVLYGYTWNLYQKDL